MSKLAAETHGEDLMSDFSFTKQEGFIKDLKKGNMGAKIYFNDGTNIKGLLFKADKFNFYLIHKKNIIMILKSNVKMVEPLPPLKK